MWVCLCFLLLIGCVIVLRRSAQLVPILLNGYHPPAPPANPMFAGLSRLDDIFARYPLLTMVHIVPE